MSNIFEVTEMPRLESAPAAPEWPLVMRIPDLGGNELVRLRTERMKREAGRIALGQTVEQNREIRAQHYNILEAIDRAAWQDPEAIAFLDINAETDAIERTLKTGHVIEVELEEGEDGSIMQYGQTLEDVQINAFRDAAHDPEMFGRTTAEANNKTRLEWANRAGLFEDYVMVTWSRAAVKMSIVAAAKAGFFTDTMSCAIQAVTKKDGRLKLESAFVAGIKSNGEERHDGDTVVKVADELGVDYHGLDATEIIDMPLLIHKSLMPNGVIDLVKRYDDAAGGTFFGQAKPRQDYLEYRQLCREREKAYKPIAQRIRKQLIAEVGSFKTPLEASRRLDQLSQQYTLELAIEDRTIDARVFGPAAQHIEDARMYLEQGRPDLVLESTNKAQATAVSSSCPKDMLDSINTPDSETSESSNNSESSSGDIRCIQCRKQVKKAEVVKKDCWECPECKHKVDICTGEVVNVGRLEEKPDTSIGALVLSMMDARAKKAALARVA